MNDLASIRAEIKGWERTFRSKEGRDPSIDDIKRLPDIAQKYKIYKKLSKAAAAPAPATSSQSPSTPTRPAKSRNDSRTSLISLTSRVVAPAAPLSSFNPFSPQKAKGKEREKLHTRVAQPVFNPFASPTKSRPTTTLQLPGRPNSPPLPSTAISRARKRLRGEPVSPSPSKEKRRRTGSQTILSFPRLALDSNKKPKDAHQYESEDDEHESSFVDDSPVKSFAGRAFNLLFDEAQPPPNGDIFGLNGSSSSRTLHSQPSLENGTQSKSLKPVKGNIFPASGQTRAQTPDSKASLAPNINEDRFRNRNDEVSANKDDTDMFSDKIPTPRSRSPLLAPSPPPASSWAKGTTGKGKRKADSKVYSNRKKLKLSNNEGGDESSDDSNPRATVKIVDRLLIKKVSADEDLDSEFDPVMGLRRAPGGVAHTLASPTDPSPADIDLPERFKEVLDLEASRWYGQDVDEGNLVKSLVYGRRITAYDSKKGEIWDAGEDVVNNEESRGYVDDEWEGEPVPWELAEL